MTTGNERSLRLGLIGAGRWGRNIMTALSTMPGLHLAAIASHSPDTARIAPPGCAIVRDWGEFLAPDAFDGIIVTSPTSTHGAITEAAIAAGVPIFVEKPLTLSVEEAERLLAAARNRGAIVIVDLIHLFNPSWGWITAQLPVIGPLTNITCKSGDYGPFRPDTPPLWDWLPHDLSMVLALAGPPIALCARRITSRVTEEGTCEVARLDLRFDGGIKANIVSGNDMDTKSRTITIRGKNGEITVDDVVKEGRVTCQGKTQRVAAPGGDTSPLSAALAAFGLAIRNGATDSPDTLSLAVEITRLITAITVALGPSGITEWQEVTLPTP